MRKLTKLFRSEDGAGITEFALLAPVFVGMIISIGQFGVLYFAQSGLKSAVAEGARFASVFPRPTNDEIKTKISGSRFGMNPAQIVSTEVTDCVQGGRACIDIKMVYTVPMDIVPIAWPNQTLTEERRVFVAALPTEGDKSGTGGGKGGDDDGKGGGKDKDDDTGGDTGGGTDEPDCKGKKCDTDEPSDPEPSDPTPDEPTDPEPEPEPCKNAKKCGTDPRPTEPTPTEPTPTEPTPTEPTPTEPDEPVCTKKNCK